jgi:hypothetical protein
LTAAQITVKLDRRNRLRHRLIEIQSAGLIAGSSRSAAMNKDVVEYEPDNDSCPINEIADEAIERAAQTDGSPCQTIAFCTGLDSCPA